MDKDGSATHRRHRPGPGAPPMGVGPAHLKAASEMAELQRSRSVGGLLQKGDPPSCIKKLCKELESEDPGKDVRSEAEDASCQASLEDKQDRGQDARGQALEDANVEEASTRHEQPAGGEGADECAPEDEELEPKSVKLDDLLEKEKPPVFVEIDLGDLAEEVQDQLGVLHPVLHQKEGEAKRVAWRSQTGRGEDADSCPETPEEPASEAP
ncbi:uncharacterized protein C13orf46 homolog isoform X2 [Bos indicus]|uniref:GAGE domain-containing protein n=2 Tax=Bos TaxID=9903 RepID=A0A4W2I6J2_BOBOX